MTAGPGTMERKYDSTDHYPGKGEAGPMKM